MSGHSHHARDARIERLEAELEELRAAGDRLQSDAGRMSEQNPNQRKELLEMETQDAITIAYHRNNERGFRDALALTPRAERTTKDSQAAYDLGYEEGRKVRQSLVYNIQEAPNDR